MRMHVIQHVPFEGPGLIAEWAAEEGHELTTQLASTEEFPATDEFEFLVVMGGPMDADDEDASPWLRAEKHFIAEAIASGRIILGVCLGAQILAEILGGYVRHADELEIGWYPVELTDAGATEPLFAQWPQTAVVGHWHGATFQLPMGMEAALSSELTPNQAFVFDDRVVALQFHVDWTPESLGALIENCEDDLEDRGTYMMSSTEIRDEADERIAASRELLFNLLDGMEAVGTIDNRGPETAPR